MAQVIQIRRDSATNWTNNNPILAQGELGIELVTFKIKIGDGISNWNTLSYYGALNLGIDDSDDILEGVVNLYYTESRVSANTNVAANSAHIIRTDNPHSVTPSQVGNATAQWNANQIQGEDVVDTNKVNGNALIFNGSNIVYSPTDVFVVDTQRNALTTTNSYLRTGEGTPTNTTPFILPFNATLISISISNRTTNSETWDGIVYDFGTNTILGSVNITNGYKAYSLFNVDVNAGTEIATYCAGTGVAYPKITAVFRRR